MKSGTADERYSFLRRGGYIHIFVFTYLLSKEISNLEHDMNIFPPINACARSLEILPHYTLVYTKLKSLVSKMFWCFLYALWLIFLFVSHTYVQVCFLNYPKGELVGGIIRSWLITSWLIASKFIHSEKRIQMSCFYISPNRKQDSISLNSYRIYPSSQLKTKFCFTNTLKNYCYISQKNLASNC